MAIANKKRPAVKLNKSSSAACQEKVAQSRLNVRLSPSIKKLIVKAAALNGQDLTEFAAVALSEKASLVIEQHDALILSSEEHIFFLNALDEPGVPKPSKRSLSAAEKYRRRTRKGVSYTLAD